MNFELVDMLKIDAALKIAPTGQMVYWLGADRVVYQCYLIRYVRDGILELAYSGNKMDTCYIENVVAHQVGDTLYMRQDRQFHCEGIKFERPEVEKELLKQNECVIKIVNSGQDGCYVAWRKQGSGLFVKMVDDDGDFVDEANIEIHELDQWIKARVDY